jgi:hypothetical protein
MFKFISDYINIQYVMSIRCRHFMFTACHITIFQNCNLRVGYKFLTFLMSVSARSVTRCLFCTQIRILQFPWNCSYSLHVGSEMEKGTSVPASSINRHDSFNWSTYIVACTVSGTWRLSETMSMKFRIDNSKKPKVVRNSHFTSDVHTNLTPQYKLCQMSLVLWYL